MTAVPVSYAYLYRYRLSSSYADLPAVLSTFNVLYAFIYLFFMCELKGYITQKVIPALCILGNSPSLFRCPNNLSIHIQLLL